MLNRYFQNEQKTMMRRLGGTNNSPTLCLHLDSKHAYTFTIFEWAVRHKQIVCDFYLKQMSFDFTMVVCSYNFSVTFDNINTFL